MASSSVAVAVAVQYSPELAARSAWVIRGPHAMNRSGTLSATRKTGGTCGRSWVKKWDKKQFQRAVHPAVQQRTRFYGPQGGRLRPELATAALSTCLERLSRPKKAVFRLDSRAEPVARTKALAGLSISP